MSDYLESLFSLTGKVALVTGGSRGIGEMISEALVRAGAKVYIVARKPEQCEATANRLSTTGSCIALTADINSVAGIKALVTEFHGHEDRLDILVNNAGNAWVEPIETFSEKAWDQVMDLNVKSPFFLTQALLPLLAANATGESPSQVINIGSVAGYAGNTSAFSYGPSKAAIHQLTRVLADELVDRHIHVNGIAPGYFPSRLSAGLIEDDEMLQESMKHVPIKRMGAPEDIGALTIAVATNRYMLGNVIPIDGGVLLGDPRGGHH
jgi:NAD(P)-dependent dehydrogenase (short-subunit alcohol dehydrogenase family)